MKSVEPLRASALCRYCDPHQFSFETTAELPDLTAFVGQDRAVDAVRYGIGIRQEGYNLFVLGPPGTGKHSLVSQFLDGKAAAQPVPPDWCYVNNFKEKHKPRALRVPAGRGGALKRDVAKLMEELHAAIPAAFESEDYRSRRQVIEEEFKEGQEAAFAEIQKRASGEHIALIRTPMGLGFAPEKDGEVIDPEVFKRLPETERKRVEEQIQVLQARLQETMQDMPQRLRAMREKIRDLDREVAMFAVGGLIDELRGRYVGLPVVETYLAELRSDVIERVGLFRGPQDQETPTPQKGSSQQAPDGPSPLRRYEVNLLVDHGASAGAPVVREDHPSYQNLIGRIEHHAEMGALFTDFNLIKAGALHRANGGYLMLDARKVLLQPFAWEALKQALHARALKIESLGQALSVISTVSLEPEPIPLDLKVVLIGERMIYYLLQAHDPDFGELFKVAADFDDRMDLTPETNGLFAQLIGTVARKEKLRALHRGAVARLVEYGCRLAGHSEKLSAQVRRVMDIVREADYCAQEAGNGMIGAAEVQQAIDKKVYHASRLRERLQEEVVDGTILIDTAGERVGQVNGLSVLQLGEYAFGKPSRITARLRLGAGKLLDIEREVELGGPLHSKGVLILSGYLGARYAPDRPLSLSASLVFEQSYGGVDGDSASSAELYALLSALAQAPIAQSLAVTGSVNQYGDVQAIGGANEKIEGFFDLCRARGLTGEQGVLIPASNVKHLMLRRDVVEAVEAGQFRVFPIETVDQGIAVLTGTAAGARDAEGAFPEGTINHRVEARLNALAEKRHAFAEAVKEGARS